MVSSKICTKCLQKKNSDLFQKRDNVKSGLSSWCKECTQDYINRMAPSRRRNRKEYAINKLGGKCYKCGGIFPYYVYDLHHNDPLTKTINMANLQDKSIERVNEELSKCVLLCSNCHRIEHHKNNSSGKLISKRVLDEELVLEMRRYYNSGEHTIQQTADHFHFKLSTTRAAVRMENWKNIGGKP